VIGFQLPTTCTQPRSSPLGWFDRTTIRTIMVDIRQGQEAEGVEEAAGITPTTNVDTITTLTITMNTTGAEDTQDLTHEVAHAPIAGEDLTQGAEVAVEAEAHQKHLAVAQGNLARNLANANEVPKAIHEPNS